MGGPKCRPRRGESIKAWSNNAHMGPMVTWALPDSYGVPQLLEALQNGTKCYSIEVPWGLLTWPYLLVQILPFRSGKPPTTSGPFRSTACDPGIRRKVLQRGHYLVTEGWCSWYGPVLRFCLLHLKQFWISLILCTVQCLPLTWYEAGIL